MASSGKARRRARNRKAFKRDLVPRSTLDRLRDSRTGHSGPRELTIATDTGPDRERPREGSTHGAGFCTQAECITEPGLQTQAVATAGPQYRANA